MSDQPPQLKYFFSVKHSEVESRPVGEIPGGFRVDLRYGQQPKSVFTDPKRYCTDWTPPSFYDGLTAEDKHELGFSTNPAKAEEFYAHLQERRKDTSSPIKGLLDRRVLEWFGFDGEFVSGGDWSLVRDDGVLLYNGRITIRSDDSNEQEGRFLVDAVISGVVDLRDRQKDSLSGQRAYRSWQLGTLPNTTIPITMAVRFEAADRAETWAADRYKLQARHFWKYQRLIRGQFIAVGTAGIKKDERFSPIRQVAFDVFEVTR